MFYFPTMMPIFERLAYQWISKAAGCPAEIGKQVPRGPLYVVKLDLFLFSEIFSLHRHRLFPVPMMVLSIRSGSRRDSLDWSSQTPIRQDNSIYTSVIHSALPNAETKVHHAQPRFQQATTSPSGSTQNGGGAGSVTNTSQAQSMYYKGASVQAHRSC
jgi:hypothetical protein